MAERNLIDLWNEYCCEEMGGELVLFENTRETINDYFSGMKPWYLLFWIGTDDYNFSHKYFYIKNWGIHSTNCPESVIEFTDLDEYCGRVYNKSYEDLCFEPEDGE